MAWQGAFPAMQGIAGSGILETAVMVEKQIKGDGNHVLGQLSYPRVLVSLLSSRCLRCSLVRATLCLLETGEFMRVYKLNRHFIKFR